MDTELRTIYYDPEQGLLSAKKLWEKTGKKYTLKQVSEWIKNQEAHQRLIGQHKKIVYPAIRAPKIGYYQIDLLEVPKVTPLNNKARYIFNLVDIYSRKAFSQPITQKTPSKVLEAFKIMDLKNPIRITSDDGSEWKGVFRKYLDNKHIIHTVVYPGQKNKMSIVERFNQTLRNYIERYKTAMNTNKWIDVLQKLVRNYNNTEHSTIGTTPNKVWNGAKPQNIERAVKQTAKAINKAQDFKVGTKVRTLINRKTFDKGRKKYSADVKTITRINMWAYYVDNERRPYAYYELKKVDTVEQAPQRQATKKPQQKRTYKEASVERPKTRGKRVDLKKLGVKK